MIFVTVGHQMPFDRLVHAVDQWSQRTGRADVFAQIGDTNNWPTHIQAVRFLTPEQFTQRMEQATAIVAHAGTGTIIAALKLQKPLLVLTRESARGETRNDHQIATARHFEQAGHVLAAYDEQQLITRMDELESFRPRATIDSAASEQLLRRLRDFTFGDAASSVTSPAHQAH